MSRIRPPSDDELAVAAWQTTKRLERWLDLKERKDFGVGDAASDGKSTSREDITYPEDWRLSALCLESNGDWTEIPQVQLAVAHRYKAVEIAICFTCPVQDPCLEAGLSELIGIWGGRLPKERRAIVRQRKKTG